MEISLDESQLRKDMFFRKLDAIMEKYPARGRERVLNSDRQRAIMDAVIELKLTDEEMDDVLREVKAGQ